MDNPVTGEGNGPITMQYLSIFKPI